MLLALNPAVADTPFRLQVALADVVVHPAWGGARAALRAALGRGQVAVLLGAPGTGKTLLLRNLAQALRQEGQSVQLIERGDGLDPAVAADVLLVDEADRMSAAALAWVCEAGRPAVLAALPRFATIVAELGCPVATVTLEPLPPEEVARFVAARLAAAGRRRDLLEPEAVLALAEHSGGLLRAVNALAGAAVFLAELEQAPRVGRQHVDEAVAMRGSDGEVSAASAEDVPAPEPEPVATAELVAAAQPEAAPLAPSGRHRPWWPSAAGAAATALGLVLAGGWAVSGWHFRPPPTLPVGGGTAERSSEPATEQPPQGQADSRNNPVEGARDTAESVLPSEPTSASQQAVGAKELRHAGPVPRPQPVPPGASLAFRGAVYNETMQQGGQMSLVIRRQQPVGAVTARFEAWAGLLGSGELTGQLSEDGHLRASGQLMMGRNAFTCELSGTIAGGWLTGSARFVRVGGSGYAAHSSFTLSRS